MIIDREEYRMKNNTDKKYKRVHPMNFFVLFLAGIINAVRGDDFSCTGQFI